MKHIQISAKRPNISPVARVAATAVLLLASLIAHAKTASEVYEQVAGSTVIVRPIDKASIDTDSVEQDDRGKICSASRNALLRKIKTENVDEISSTLWNQQAPIG